VAGRQRAGGGGLVVGRQRVQMRRIGSVLEPIGERERESPRSVHGLLGWDFISFHFSLLFLWIRIMGWKSLGVTASSFFGIRVI
jgi:hypothetical protein